MHLHPDAGLALRHRPLVWLAPALVGGGALGGHLGQSLGTVATRDAPILLLPLLAALLPVVLAWRWRTSNFLAACVAAWLGFAALGATLTARRVLPPADDISRLVALSPERDNAKAQQRLPILLKGRVVGPPRRGDYGLQFVLHATLPRAGYVWVEAPLDATIEEGDTIQADAELADLPLAGNAGERSRHLRFIVEKCWCLARIKAAGDITLQPQAPRSSFTLALTRLRAHIRDFYTAEFQRRGQPYPGAIAQLLTAMVFGEGVLHDPLPPQTREEFRVAGLSHVLVASGTQIAVFGLLLLGLAHLLGVRRWWMIAIVLPTLMLYALLAGGEASIMRAAIGGACLCLAVLLGRDVDGLSLWSLALITLLLHDPALLYGLNFQLTFAAAWGLIALAPPLRRGLGTALGTGKPAQALAFTLGAQLATIPLLLFYFGRLSVVGLATNIIGSPLAGVLVATGMLGLLIQPINFINYWLTVSLATLATRAAQAPGAQIEGTRAGPGWTVLSYVAILGLIGMLSLKTASDLDSASIRHTTSEWWRKQRERLQLRHLKTSVPLLLVLLAAILVWHQLFPAAQQLRVTMLDVGQGESILVEAPGGRTVLIDGGTLATTERGDVGRSVIVPYLRSRGIKQLDAVVVTHADADHLNALPHLLREVPVGMMLDGAATSDGDKEENAPAEIEYQRVLAVANERGIPRKVARAGQRLHLGGGAVLSVLAPTEPTLESGNNNSIVMRLDYGKTSVLLTGDIEREAEERLVRRGANLKCTILKVAHHGSKTSTSPLFLRAAQPSAAIISCGRYNPFGHPAMQTLKQLNAARIPYYRTDVAGAVELRSDGQRCWVQTFR